MKRFVCLALSALCVLGLFALDRLWDGLSDQSLFRLPMPVDSVVRDRFAQIAAENDAELGVFAMRTAQLGVLGTTQDIVLSECLSYHPEAFGVLMLSGSPITQAQIEQGEAVVMLSEDAAMSRFPALDCIDAIVELDDKPHRVVGVYRDYEPLGLLTRTTQSAAIAPMPASSDVRRVYVWLHARKASPFVFQQAKTGLASLIKDVDAGEFQATDLGGMSQMNRQGVRFWLLLMLSVACWRMFKAFSGMRHTFYRRAKEAFSKHYGVRALIRLIGPFLWGMLPSLALVVGLISYLVYCANRLQISAERVPTQLLDPSAWLAKLNTATMAANAVEAMSVFPYLLNAQLEWLCPVLGLLGVWLLFIGSRPKMIKVGE